MSLILNEVMERLKRQDEVSLLEILNIDSEMLVERFADLIEERMDYIETHVVDYND